MGTSICHKLKTTLTAFILSAVAMVMFPCDLFAGEDVKDGTILIIASYNPDTKRMSSFISDFEDKVGNSRLPFDIQIEDMGCKGVDEAPYWRQRMAEVLENYDPDRLRAIILLGQEAWASFLSQDTLPLGVPFFSCFASENGIRLPSMTTDMETWMPESIDMKALADSLGVAGGNLNHYDLQKNVSLITDLYPDVKHIAFVSDNTYGGISLQSYVKAQAADFPAIDFIFVDGRHGEEDAMKQISSLPPNSAILLGTWRVGRLGQYLMYRSMDNLVAANPNVPVFSLTGTGMGQAAIGGFIPRYDSGAEEIMQQLAGFYNGRENSVNFTDVGGEYKFDRQKLNSFGIEDYKLPHKSIVVDNTEAQFRKYRNYFFIGLAALILLTLVLIFFYYLYYKNKALKDELQERESELIAAKDRAEESDKLKSAFLANMSHEIRTPLNAIVGFSSLLTGELDNEERAEYTSIIATNSNLMLTLISDILDISRLEADRMGFNFTETDLVSLCQQVILTTTHNRKPGVECVLECDYDKYLLRTDVQRLTQVFINLLTNAGKFTEEGRITISFKELPGSRIVEFAVTDTGCGIPPEKQARVFERFEKLDEFQQGTGLGLSICKQICMRFGGKIWIDKDYTTGSRFVFTHSTRL